MDINKRISVPSGPYMDVDESNIDGYGYKYRTPFAKNVLQGACTVLDLRTRTSQRCEAVPGRAHI